MSISGYISSRLMAAYDLNAHHTIHVALVETTDEGRNRYHYILECNGAVIFDAEDFSGRQDSVDYAAAAMGVLAFLALRPGDVESEYFDHYTPKQIAWRDEYAEELSMLVGEYEDGEAGA